MRDHAFQPAFDEAKLHLAREFLRREFRDGELRDNFSFDRTAQVFVIDVNRDLQHMLVIPRETFEDAEFAELFNTHLLTTLKAAGRAPVTLTSQGAWY
jgi:hypothetical protein